MRRALAFVLLVACSDPAPPASSAIELNGDGVQVHVGGRDISVRCATACEGMRTELTRMSAECTTNPASQPHILGTNEALLTIACCQEASTAYDRACGHETLIDCSLAWSTECQGTAFHGTIGE